jgi:hypothetical protein
MPSIVVQALDEASNDVSDVSATMDGAPLLERLDGTEILINPGEHHLALEAAGFRRAEATFVARERQKGLRVVVFLGSARNPALTQSMVSSAARPPGRHDESPTLSKGRRVGLALGYAGVGSLAVGTILSILSKTTYDHAFSSECGGDPNRCSAQGIADGRKAHREATIATFGFVTAGVLLAAGAALYFASPKEDGVAVVPAVEKSGGGLAVVGKW